MFYPNNRLLPLRILSYQGSTVAASITSLAIYMLYIYYLFFTPDFQWSIPENIKQARYEDHEVPGLLKK